MAKGPGLYSAIGNKAQDLLYKDYQSDQKFSIYFTHLLVLLLLHLVQREGTCSWEMLTRITVDEAAPSWLCAFFQVFVYSCAFQLLTTITVDEAAPGLKTIVSFKVPDQRSGKLELQYLHDYAPVLG
ncbi:hypothetical protein RND81_05G173600 [Saponaria officinalis]|uniref:Uncharacterized protein n=1 Tax=Saponaria officinalis TaxID=3572 RepID=A0AAW1KZ63_SAPOF